MICRCGASFRRLHPEINKCRCGDVYDGKGNLMDAEQKSLSSRNKLIQISQQQQNVEADGFYNKPGSALESLIPDWAVQFKTGCKCKDFRDKMDKWQTAGCEARRDTIVSHLMSQSDLLIPVFRGIPTALRKAAATRLVNKAIEMSRG